MATTARLSQGGTRSRSPGIMRMLQCLPHGDMREVMRTIRAKKESAHGLHNFWRGNMDSIGIIELPGSTYLYALAFVAAAFVGFSSIVVVIRQTIGATLSRFQVLLEST